MCLCVGHQLASVYHHVTARWLVRSGRGLWPLAPQLRGKPVEFSLEASTALHTSHWASHSQRHGPPSGSQRGQLPTQHLFTAAACGGEIKPQSQAGRRAGLFRGDMRLFQKEA